MSDANPEPGQAGQAATRRLVGETAKMASGTMVSRILGFVKAALLVYALGAANPQAESFTYATLVPNTLYMLFAGGALNTVLVPQIVRHMKSDADGGEAFVNRIVTAFLAALAAVTVVACVLTPQVMTLWTSATWRTPALAPHWSMLVLMAFLTMPQLFFFGAFFLVGQVLNARDEFAPLMWAPIVNNLVGIAVLGAYMLTWGTNAAHGQPFTTEQVLLLGLGSTLGIVLQTVALLPALRKVGFRYRPRWDLRGAGLGATFHLAKWMLGYVLLTSIAQVVVSRLASDATVAVKDLPGAGMTAYQNAYLIWILPHSLLTVSLATAMLPSASRLAAAHDLAGVAAETTRTLRLATTFLLPASVGLLVLGYPFVQLFFGYGRGADSWQFIAFTLLGFAVGLVPFTLQYVYLRGFYALEDTRTPFLLQCLVSGANIALAWLLVLVDNNPLTVAPRLALAYSLAYTLGAWATHRALSRRLPGLQGRALLGHLGRLLGAVLPGAAVAALVAWLTGGGSRVVVAAGFVGAAAIALVSFFFVAKRLRIAEATQLVAVLRRRGSDAEAPAGEAAVSEPTASEPVSEPASEPVASRGTPLLAYPDPSGTRPDLDIPGGAGPVSTVRAGQLLGERYRLDQVLSRRGGTLTWLGRDLALSRPVLLHLMHPGEPRTLEILDQARQAAPAVDARFLRVWDAVLVEGSGHGSYIVCEYAPGQSLELALRQGPFTDVEAAWMVRELADGLVAMHAKGLYHRQLNPDTVVITASGNVKIVGFLVEAALHPEPDDDTDGEAQDVRALGELLYAALLGRWPGGARYGLPAAPTDHQGRPLLPRQVSARVSRTLDVIVDRILSPVPQARASRLTTAQDVARALGAALGGADASRDLDERLRFPVTQVQLTVPKPKGGDLLASPLAAGAGAAVVAPVPDPRPTDAEASDPGQGDATQAWFDPFADATAERDAHADPDAHLDPYPHYATPGEADDTEPFTPIPPPAQDRGVQVVQAAPLREPSRRYQAVLAGCFVIVFFASFAVLFTGEFTRSRTPAPTPGTPYPVAAARDFDPRADGGDNRENPDRVARAIDADAATAWTTEVYGRSADFNGRKPGVGLIVDLGEARRVGWVTLDLGEGVTVADLRVPQDTTATTPPLTGRDAWRVVQAIPASGGRVVVKLDSSVETRFLMVYLTRLPQRGDGFQGSISSVFVSP